MDFEVDQMVDYGQRMWVLCIPSSLRSQRNDTVGCFLLRRLFHKLLLEQTDGNAIFAVRKRPMRFGWRKSSWLSLIDVCVAEKGFVNKICPKTSERAYPADYNMK